MDTAAKDTKEKKRPLLEHLKRLTAKMVPRSTKTELLWRGFEKDGNWTAEYADKLVEDINRVELLNVNGVEIKTINILLCGQIASGKSSFRDTVASIDTGRIVMVEGLKTSLKHKLRCFKPRNRLKNFKLFNTIAFEQSDSGEKNIKDILLLVKGHVPKNYKFDQGSPINEESERFDKDAKVIDRMHCVVFVIDAVLVVEDNIPRQLIKKIRDLRDTLRYEGIPQIVLLTKIDCICDEVETDTTKTYESKSVYNAVQMTSILFRLPERQIFPVQNYTCEIGRNHLIEILHLLALRQMVYIATNYLSYNVDEDDESDTDS